MTRPMPQDPRYQDPTYQEPTYQDPARQDPARQGPAQPGRAPRPRVDARALWAGGAATAVVAALAALVGILVIRWLFKIPILAPQRDGAWGDASTGAYVFAAAAVAIAATGITHLLAAATPKPSAFFGWIMGLATLIAVVFPFSTTAPLSQKLATAVVNLAIGFAIGSLLSGVAARATRQSVAYADEAPAGNPDHIVR